MQLPTTKTDIQIRHTDIDLMGHVSNTVFCEYLEIGRVAWFQAIPGKTIPAVTVNLNINYHGEIRLGEKVYVTTHCSKVGNKSVELTQEIFANERSVSRATVIVVGFDTVSRKSAPFPAEWEPSEVFQESS